jgi:hypothetical protein
MASRKPSANPARMDPVDALDAELFEAVQCAASDETITTLLNRGANPSTLAGEWGGQAIDAFGWAIKTNDLDLVALLATHANLDRDVVSTGSPLCWAAKQAHPELLTLFLSLGADPNLASIGGLFTPLMAACSQAAPERPDAERCVEILAPLSRGSARVGQDVGIFAGADALIMLAWCQAGGSVRSAQTLLSICDPTSCSKSGMTAFMAACWRGRLDLAKLLLPHSDLDAKDDRGCDALDQACGAVKPWLEGLKASLSESSALRDAAHLPAPKKARRGL